MGAFQRWYTLTVLIVAYVLSFIDRQILSILVEPLKQDLHLSDTEISLLQGLFFAIFLALAGLPLGRLIDKGRRVRIAAGGIAVWSVATATCALASAYPMLLLCRIGVGVGEATLTPAAHAIVADSFPRRQLGLALGVFGIGSYVGSGAALLLGAAVMSALQGYGLSLPIIGTLKPWQCVFAVVGLPGLLIAGWVATLPESYPAGGRIVRPSLRAAWHVLQPRFASLVAINLTAAFTAMAIYAMGAWIPSYLIRTFGWSVAQAGSAYGLVVIVCGILGVVTGGTLSDMVVARGVVAGRLIVMVVASFCAAPLAAAAMLASTGWWSVALLAPVTSLATISLGILPAAQQAIVSGPVRGITASMGVLMVNVIGLGVGPTAIALITDFALHDPKLIRYALAVALPAMLLVSAAIGAVSLPRYGRTAGLSAAE
jgi:MFS family permease